MSGFDLLSALGKLPREVLAEPVVVSNCDPGEGAFFPARPFTGEMVRVVGFGRRPAIVIGRDLQVVKTKHRQPFRTAYKPGSRRVVRPAKATVPAVEEFEDLDDGD